MTAASSGTIGGHSASITASSEDGSGPGWRSFDGNTASPYWYTISGTFSSGSPYDDTGSPVTISVDLGSGNAEQVTGLKLRGFSGAGSLDASPDVYKLRYSDDGSTWYDVPGLSFSGVNTYNTTHEGTIDPNVAAATSLSWNEGASHNALTINASWTKSTDTLTSQELWVYKDANCYDQDGSKATLSGTDTTEPFTVSTDQTTYYFKIRSISNGGYMSDSACSAGIAVSTDSTAPTPGNSGTIGTSSVTSSGVTLSWTEGTDNLSAQANLQYEVRQSSSNNITTVANAEANGSIIQAYTAADSGHTVTGLQGNATYYFNVIVKDEGGNKAVYTTASATTSAQAAPPNPTSPSAADDSPSAITVSWTSGGGSTTGYKIAWALTSAPGNCSSGTVIPASSITGTSHQVTGLSANTLYGFRICAVNNNATPDVSSGVTTTETTTNVLPADVPASFEPLPGFTAEGLSMTWTAGSNTVGYIIYRQDTGNGDITWAPTNSTVYTTSTDITGNTGADASSKIIYVGTALSHTDGESLVDNKTYMYKIFAYNTGEQYSTTVVLPWFFEPF